MEIRDAIPETKRRIRTLQVQNRKFEKLLEKARDVVLNSTASVEELRFVRQIIETVDEEKENLKKDLSDESRDVAGKIKAVEELCQVLADEVEHVQREHAEIKFLLTHRKGEDTEWLRSILQLEKDPAAKEGELMRQRAKLQRKILNVERKKDEMLTVIREASAEDNSQTSQSENVDDEQYFKQYEDLRFLMLNLESERSRLLRELQEVLDKSRKEIAEEYDVLQNQILQVGRQKALLKVSVNDQLEACERELENIFNAFTNVASNDEKEAVRSEGVGRNLDARFGDGYDLPFYCAIL